MSAKEDLYFFLDTWGSTMNGIHLVITLSPSSSSSDCLPDNLTPVRARNQSFPNSPSKTRIFWYQDFLVLTRAAASSYRARPFSVYALQGKRNFLSTLLYCQPAIFCLSSLNFFKEVNHTCCVSLRIFQENDQFSKMP